MGNKKMGRPTDNPKDMTRNEFRSWSRAASKAKVDYQRKLITGDEMMRIVKTY
ncbi:CopG family transcriptional regulator [Lutispora sp.]|uniref:CopG family transcriptional regulator n=1 Tax=Lutispora sp. TaxID=2828727 RepID=UPI000EBB52CC|nr:CopG family transcriptional regulator [Lutispora sp.]MEA4963213.1 CopG family transcriptional regulator [Lutispora sp.]HCJ56459.1 CopG family transcriptional regulator [Clostridiaceae bacterium]